MSRCTFRPQLADSPKGDVSTMPVALAVVRSGARARMLTDPGSTARVLVTGFDALDAGLLREHEPAVIFAGAVSWGFDAVDLALHLAGLGFRSRLVVIARDIPDLDLLRLEIESASPNLRLEVVSIGAAETRRVHAI